MAQPPGEFQPRPLLRALIEHGVDFVLIGGLAGIVHGSAYNTYDLDIAYARDRPNLERLAAALRELGATLRGAPPDVPFQLDANSLYQGSNFTFETRWGSLDLLGEPSGAPPYQRLRDGAGDPVLIDGDFHCSDSSVVCAYLDEAYGGYALLPEGPRDRWPRTGTGTAPRGPPTPLFCSPHRPRTRPYG